MSVQRRMMVGLDDPGRRHIAIAALFLAVGCGSSRVDAERAVRHRLDVLRGRRPRSTGLPGVERGLRRGPDAGVHRYTLGELLQTESVLHELFLEDAAPPG